MAAHMENMPDRKNIDNSAHVYSDYPRLLEADSYPLIILVTNITDSASPPN